MRSVLRGRYTEEGRREELDILSFPFEENESFRADVSRKCKYLQVAFLDPDHLHAIALRRCASAFWSNTIPTQIRKSVSVCHVFVNGGEKFLTTQLTQPTALRKTTFVIFYK